jgi:hypothetical protein
MDSTAATAATAAGLFVVGFTESGRIMVTVATRIVAIVANPIEQVL